MTTALPAACFLLAASLVPSPKRPSSGRDAVRLEVGRPHEEDIGPGERHAYRIAVGPAMALRIHVEQHGIDLVVDLVDPGGGRIDARDDTGGTSGPLRLMWVSGVAGELRLELYSRVSGAPRGRYRMEVAGLHTATDRDRALVVAEAKLGEATRRRKQATAESHMAAIEAYTEAASLCRQAEDPGCEGHALGEIGYVEFQRGSLRSALTSFQRALEASRRAGDRAEESTGLSNMAATYRGLGEPQKAVELYASALEIKRALGRPAEEAICLNNLGVLQGDLGSFQDALGTLETALELHRSVLDRVGEARTLLNLGSLYDQLGEESWAMELLVQALQLARQLAEVQLEAESLTFIASIRTELGDLSGAREALLEALRLQRGRGDRRGEARIMLRLGVLDDRARDWPEAQRTLEQSVALARSVGDSRTEASALVQLAAVQARTQGPVAARTSYRAALALHRSFGDGEGEALALHGLARVAAGEGDLQGAVEHSEAAVRIVESLRAKLSNIGLRDSYPASLPELYEDWVDALMRRHAAAPEAGHDAAALAASERGRARTFLELLHESRVEVREGVEPGLLQQERSLLGRLGFKLDRHMRLLSNGDAGEEAKGLAVEIESLRAEHEQVQARIRTTSPRFAALTQPTPLGLAAIQGKLLDSDSLLLEYSLGRERSYLWAITASSIRSYVLPGRGPIEEATRQAYESLSNATRTPGSPAETRRRLAALGNMLLAPVAEVLEARRLVVVPDGGLHYMPFGALPDPAFPDRPLVMGHEIVSLPSASTLDVLREQRRLRPRSATKTLAVFADPVFDAGDERVLPAAGHRVAASRRIGQPSGAGPGLALGGSPGRLPFTRREAMRILALVPEGDRKQALDFDASRRMLSEGGLARYRFVHLATHGFLNSTRPELSGIVLSLVDRQGREQEGFLAAPEVFNLDLDADLLVLSGCSTGLGQEIRGEGLVGLTRAFMYAGAARVVASLWKVDDAATAELMGRFYEAMLGPARMRPPAALRSAQQGLIRDSRWRDPFFWAAFQLQGDWN